MISPHATTRSRRGFAMLVTLWVMTVAAVVTLAGALAGRRSELETMARVELERARWLALGCERRAQFVADNALRSSPSLDSATRVWRLLGSIVPESPLLAGCNLHLEAAGTRLDVNGADVEMLVRLFDALGFGERAVPMAEALGDWRDSDDVASANGAESAWYRAAQRMPPRNAAIADNRELRRIRGFEDLESLDSVLTTDEGRVSLATASAPVLMSVPGITREIADRIVASQLASNPPKALTDVLGSISRASVDSLTARYTDAVRLTTPDPDAWEMSVSVGRGRQPVSVRLTWRLVRAGRRTVVASTRSSL